MKTSVARREFLMRAAQSLGSAALGSVLFDTVLGHFLCKAYAEASGQSLPPAMNYLHLSFLGGPPRWMFDQLLTPAGRTDTNFRPGQFGTQYVKSGSIWTTDYVVHPFNVNGKTVHLPPVWGMGVGGQDFSQLLPNTVFVRGMDMEINNHDLSNRRQVAPIVGGFSITGVVADASNRPIPSLADPGTPASAAFRSKRGFAASAISYTETSAVNPALTLLSPFKDFRAGRAVHRADRIQLQSQALARFENFAKATGVTESALPQMYDNAMMLLDANIVRIADQWAATVAKYRQMVSEAIHPTKGTLPGIYDKAIPGAAAGTKGGIFSFDPDSNTITLPDIRDMVVPGTALPRMAENFALAELLADVASSALTLSFPPQTALNSTSRPWSATHDQHFVGKMVSVMQTTLFYRAFLGCLNELVTQLKAKGVFDRTVIHIGAEFSRTPKKDGSGSDHGYMSGNTTLISGMIKDVGVVGNIKVADYSSTYPGTFGVGDIYELDGFRRPIQVNDVALTITSMLGVDSVVTNGRSLLSPSGGRWALRKEEAKNNA